MQIHDQGGDPRTLNLAGRLDTESALLLEAAVVKALEAAPKELRLEMESVDYLSSAGLRELVRAHKLAAAKAERFGVARASDRVRYVRRVAGLAHVLLD